jgi:hypothetical protein
MRLILSILVIIIIYSCTENSNSSQNIQEKDSINGNSEENIELKKYIYPDVFNDSDFVKVFNVYSNDSITKSYSLKKNISDTSFYVERYSNNIVRESKSITINNDKCLTTTKYTQYKNGDSLKHKIIKQNVLSYNAFDTTYIAEYEATYQIFAKIKNYYNNIYIGKDSLIIDNKEVECIVFYVKRVWALKDYRTFNKDAITTVHLTYYAEGLGFVKSITYYDNDTIISTLQEIISIEDFNTLKD